MPRSFQHAASAKAIAACQVPIGW